LKHKLSKPIFNLVVFASGGGGNFQALIDKQSNLGYKIILLIVDRRCPAIDRAKLAKIPFLIIDKQEFKKPISQRICRSIPKNTNLIVLAGFLSIVNKNLCKKWQNKIINTHPSLLPKYGGKGMIGVKVQEAVMKAKEERAGCTIHFVTDKIDAGQTILQKSIKINYQQTPWQLGGRIHEEEKKLLPQAVKIVMNNYIKETT